MGYPLRHILSSYESNTPTGNKHEMGYPILVLFEVGKAESSKEA